MYPKHYYDLFRSTIEPGIVFVGMSFSETEQYKWTEIISPAITHAGLKAYRVDTEVIGGSILIDILNGIAKAKILLFEVSTNQAGMRNGNVMYELGIAHALRYPEEILLLRSDTNPLLFDVSNIRVINYDTDDSNNSVNLISGLLKHLNENIDSTKNLVLDKIISMLDEVSLGLLQSKSNLNVFSLKELDKAFSPQVIEIRSSIRHLLELGILEVIFRKNDRTYGYSWTRMGLDLLRKLGFRGVIGSDSIIS